MAAVSGSLSFAPFQIVKWTTEHSPTIIFIPSKKPMRMKSRRAGEGKRTPVSFVHFGPVSQVKRLQSRAAFALVRTLGQNKSVDFRHVQACLLKFEQAFWQRENLSMRFKLCRLETAFFERGDRCPGTCPQNGAPP